MRLLDLQPIAILGSTGLLGQALTKSARERKLSFVGLARKGVDRTVDATNPSVLRKVLDSIGPKVIINAAAHVNVDACERERGTTYLLNAGVVATLVEYCYVKAIKLCHISTDHYFTGDADSLHSEESPVRLVNEYARSKYAGEAFALTRADSLVLRTNIVGFRGWSGQPTFVEWAISSLTARESVTLFADFFTSSLDADSFADASFELLEQGASGLLNLAAREPASKARFVLTLAQRLDLPTGNCKIGSIRTLEGTPRAESLGLDVSRAEAILGHSLPGTEAVIDSLVKTYRAKSHEVRECN